MCVCVCVCKPRLCAHRLGMPRPAHVKEGEWGRIKVSWCSWVVAGVTHYMLHCKAHRFGIDISTIQQQCGKHDIIAIHCSPVQCRLDNGNNTII